MNAPLAPADMGFHALHPAPRRFRMGCECCDRLVAGVSCRDVHRGVAPGAADTGRAGGGQCRIGRSRGLATGVAAMTGAAGAAAPPPSRIRRTSGHRRTAAPTGIGRRGWQGSGRRYACARIAAWPESQRVARRERITAHAHTATSAGPAGAGRQQPRAGCAIRVSPAARRIPRAREDAIPRRPSCSTIRVR